MPLKLEDAAKAIEKATDAKLARATVDLPLPIYGGRYAARFGLLDTDDMDEFLEGLEQLELREAPAEDQREHAAKFIVQSCRCMLALPEDADHYDLLEHDDGRPVRFDKTFAKAAKLEGLDGAVIDSGVDVVLACWVTREPDGSPGPFAHQAFGRFSEKLLRWMQNTARRVEGEVVGGPQGGAQ